MVLRLGGFAQGKLRRRLQKLIRRLKLEGEEAEGVFDHAAEMAIQLVE